MTRIGSVHQTVGYAKYVEKVLGWRSLVVDGTLLFRMAPGLYTSYYMTSMPEKCRDRLLFATCHPLSGLAGNVQHATFLLDLTQGKGDIWRRMDRDSARKLVRRAEERGVVVREALSEPDVRAYWELLNTFRASKGLRRTPFSYTSELLRCLPGIARLFVAEKGGRMLAGQIVTAYDGYVLEWGLCRDPMLREALYPQELLKWKILEWSVDSGQKWYDFSGTGATEGIRRWKAKFGGKEVRFSGVHHPSIVRRLLLKAVNTWKAWSYRPSPEPVLRTWHGT